MNDRSDGCGMLNNESDSEATIYRRAVATSNGDESIQFINSSDEFVNNSDESMTADKADRNNTEIEMNVESFDVTGQAARTSHMGEEPQPHASHQAEPRRLPPPPTPRERAEQLIKEAEWAKERLLNVAGRKDNTPVMVKHDETGDLVHSVIVDEEYSAIASHVDESLKRQVMRGEYVDLVRLLPQDHVQQEEDQRLEMINRGGFTYWVPVSDRNTTIISNIAKWEEAFRIYSRVYTEGNPSRATELIQYNHIIHEAALEYPWENVYSYDREFHIHMSRYPSRNWGIILQQAWTLKMKRTGGSLSNKRDQQQGQGNGNGRSRRNICWKFNQGKCTFGVSCKFEHRCGICNKWGHRAWQCRKGKDEYREHDFYDNETGERGRHHHREHHEPRNDRYHYNKKKWISVDKDMEM